MGEDISATHLGPCGAGRLGRESGIRHLGDFGEISGSPLGFEYVFFRCFWWNFMAFLNMINVGFPLALYVYIHLYIFISVYHVLLSNMIKFGWSSGFWREFRPVEDLRTVSRIIMACPLKKHAMDHWITLGSDTWRCSWCQQRVCSIYISPVSRLDSRGNVYIHINIIHTIYGIHKNR